MLPYVGGSVRLFGRAWPVRLTFGAYVKIRERTGVDLFTPSAFTHLEGAHLLVTLHAMMAAAGRCPSRLRLRLWWALAGWRARGRLCVDLLGCVPRDLPDPPAGSGAGEGRAERITLEGLWRQARVAGWTDEEFYAATPRSLTICLRAWADHTRQLLEAEAIRADARAGVIAAVIANGNRGKGTNPYHPHDFFPSLSRPLPSEGEPDEDAALDTPEDQLLDSMKRDAMQRLRERLNG